MVKRDRLFHISLVFYGLLASTSCSTPNTSPVSGPATNRYFSLIDFFGGEVDRLTKMAPTVNKTVVRNGASEEQRVKIDDWENELALFMDSDINKPAWRESYRIDSTEYTLTYTSVDPELRTQKITIQKNESGLVTHIAIQNHTDNMLYQTAEKLDYYTDSLYQIDKQQQVRVIGDNHYVVKASLLREGE